MDEQNSIQMHKLLDALISSSNSVKQLYKWIGDASGTITHLINSNIDDDICNKLIKYYKSKINIINKFVKELE